MSDPDQLRTIADEISLLVGRIDAIAASTDREDGGLLRVSDLYQAGTLIDHGGELLRRAAGASAAPLTAELAAALL